MPGFDTAHGFLEHRIGAKTAKTAKARKRRKRENGENDENRFLGFLVLPVFLVAVFTLKGKRSKKTAKLRDHLPQSFLP